MGRTPPTLNLAEGLLYQEPDHCWIEDELREADLGDKRRTKRLMKIGTQIAKDPQASIPGSSRSWADTKATYRLFDNDAAEPPSILAPHRKNTIQRAAQEPVILAVQDTSTLNFTNHPAAKGMGNIGGNSTGFFVHSCLAVSAENGVPLGLLDQQAWARPPKGTPSKDPEKESRRWIETMHRSAEGIPETTHVILVGDREAAFYDLFCEANEHDYSVLVRAKANRQTENGPLWETVIEAPVAGRIAAPIPRKQDRSARTANLELRFREVTISPPPGKHGPDLTLTAVAATEPHPPKGEKGVAWLLLTTLSVTNADDAAKCVKWYTYRWRIERYFYALKSGCKVQELQLETRDRLERALALYSVIAWRIAMITYAARESPDEDCTVFLSESEWKALYASVHRTRDVPEEPPSLRQAVRWIAQIGGFLGRKGDGEPGMKVIWRGLVALHERAYMWDVLMSGDVGNA